VSVDLSLGNCVKQPSFVFSGCKDIMMEISRREKEAGIVPDPDIDTYMKVHSVTISNFFLSAHFKVPFESLVLSLEKSQIQSQY